LFWALLALYLARIPRAVKGPRRAPLEESRFGIRTGRAEEIQAADLPALDAYCRDQNLELLIARCDAADTPAAQALEEAGGRLMDTIVYWERDYQKRPLECDSGDDRVRVAEASDERAVIEIARESFAGYYGHYHADKRLDRTATDAAYVDWAERSLRDPGVADAVLVAEVGGRILGFCTTQMETDDRCNWILAAVAAEGRRHGIYRAMGESSMAWAKARGAKAFYSSTQIGNVAVQKVWARLGMEFAKAVHTFHWWRSR